MLMSEARTGSSLPNMMMLSTQASTTSTSTSSETVSAAADILGHYLSDEDFQTQVKTVTVKITATTKADIILIFIDTLYHPNPLSAVAVEKLNTLEDTDKELLSALGLDHSRPPSPIQGPRSRWRLGRMGFGSSNGQ